MKDTTAVSSSTERTRGRASTGAGAGSPPPPVKPAAATLHQHRAAGGGAQPQGGETGPQSRPESTFTGECQWSFQSMQLRQRSRTQTDTSENKGPGSAVLNALVSGFQLMGKGFHEHRAQAPAGS